MSLEHAPGPPDAVDVDAIMRAIHERIRERRQAGHSDAEVARLTDERIERALDGADFDADLLDRLRGRSSRRWNFTIDGDTLYASTHGDVTGWLLAAIRRCLNPVLRLFVNTNPLVLALHRQSQLNGYCVALLHEQALELTRLRLLVDSLKKQAAGRTSQPAETPRTGEQRE